MQVELNREAPVKPPVKSGTLTLSVQEAECLHQILNLSHRIPASLYSQYKHSGSVVEQVSSALHARLFGLGFRAEGFQG